MGGRVAVAATSLAPVTGSAVVVAGSMAGVVATTLEIVESTAVGGSGTPGATRAVGATGAAGVVEA